MQGIDKNLFVRNSKFDTNIDLSKLDDIIGVLVEMEYPLADQKFIMIKNYCNVLEHLVGHAYKAVIDKSKLQSIVDLEFVFYVDLNK